MVPRPTRRHTQPDQLHYGAQQLCHCSKWRYPHQLPCSGAARDMGPRSFSPGWDHDPSAPDFLPYSASSSRPGYSSRSRTHAHMPTYASRVETLHYNPNYYQGQTYSEVEFDPEIDGQDPAPDSPNSDRSRTDSQRSEHHFASHIDNGAAGYVLDPPIPRTYLPPRLRDDLSGRYWNAEGDSTDASGIVFPAPFGIKLSGEAFYYPSAQSGRFMNRRGEYWAGGEA